MKILHPFSNINDKTSVITSVDDKYITDAEGKRYLDFVSGLYNVGLGYSNDTLLSLIKNSSTSFCHQFGAGVGTNQSHTAMEELSTKLKVLIPWGDYVLFSNGGGDASDFAISICLAQDLSRTKIISYKNSYHGSTYLSRNTSGNLSKDTQSNIFLDFFLTTSQLSKEEYISYFEQTLINNNPDTISCFVVEPIIGSAGGFFMKENVLPELVNICRRYKIKVIFDEAITGFYRLGSRFAWSKYNVEPDVLLISKQLANGYLPLSACILNNGFDITDVKYGATTSGHPLACALANATIDILESASVQSLIEQNSIKFGNFLESFKQFDKVDRVEYSGMFGAIHFKKELIDDKLNLGGNLTSKLRESGIITRGNPRALIMSPMFISTNEDFDYVYDRLSRLL